VGGPAKESLTTGNLKSWYESNYPEIVIDPLMTEEGWWFGT